MIHGTVSFRRSSVMAAALLVLGVLAAALVVVASLAQMAGGQAGANPFGGSGAPAVPGWMGTAALVAVGLAVASLTAALVVTTIARAPGWSVLVGAVSGALAGGFAVAAGMMQHGASSAAGAGAGFKMPAGFPGGGSAGASGLPDFSKIMGGGAGAPASLHQATSTLATFSHASLGVAAAAALVSVALFAIRSGSPQTPRQARGLLTTVIR
jgi:hypothetical protein